MFLRLFLKDLFTQKLLILEKKLPVRPVQLSFIYVIGYSS